MSLRFVKTSVLSSEDGIDFSKETVIESEEAKIARIQAERASQKSLYEQLEEQKAKKQAEYDAVTKQIFSAPKAIDDEEYGFLQSLEDERSRKEEEKRIKQEEALEAFRSSLKETRSQEKSKVILPKLSNPPVAPTVTNSVQMPIVKVKRKSSEVSKEASDSKEEPKKLQKVEQITTREKKETREPEVPQSVSITSLLGDYGSDNEN